MPQLARFPFLDDRLCILRSFGRLSIELLDHCLIVTFCLELHSSSFSLQAFNFYLIILKLELVVLFVVSILLAVQELFVLSVFDVDGQSFWRKESEPLHGLWVEAYLGEGVLPVWDTQVHDHQSEVVSERVGDEEPVAAEILEPNLGFGMTSSE